MRVVLVAALKPEQKRHNAVASRRIPVAGIMVNVPQIVSSRGILINDVNK